MSSPAARFAALFDQLDPEDRLAFVADLYAARGWETHIEDGTVVATRAGNRQELAIVAPRLLRNPAIPNVDVVATTNDDAALKSAIEAANRDYLPPSELRTMLLYGLDREQAATVFERHFDQPLATVVTAADAAEGLSIREVLPSPAVTAPQVAAVVAVLLIVGVVFGGGAVLPADDPPAPTVNQTYTPGAVGALGGERNYPPGVSATGVNNSAILAEAHASSLRNRSRSYRIEASGPQHASFMFGLSAWNATVHRGGNGQYRYRKHEVAPYGFRVETVEPTTGPETRWDPIRAGDPDMANSSETLVKEVYTNDTTKFWRFNGPEKLRYRQQLVDQGDGVFLGFTDRVAWTNVFIQRFLWAENSSVSCLGVTAADDCRAYRVEVTGNPPDIRGDVTNYRAQAVVEPSGFVRSLTVRYRILSLQNMSEYLPVRFQLAYESVGDGPEPVSTPSWISEARNQTTPG